MECSCVNKSYLKFVSRIGYNQAVDAMEVIETIEYETLAEAAHGLAEKAYKMRLEELKASDKKEDKSLLILLEHVWSREENIRYKGKKYLRNFRNFLKKGAGFNMRLLEELLIAGLISKYECLQERLPEKYKSIFL